MKQRLIDANDVLKLIPSEEFNSKFAVMSSPTVEAIPVEWIKKWLNNIANNERYKNEYVELTEEVKRIIYRQAVIIRIPCVSDMLEDWRKENEVNS